MWATILPGKLLIAQTNGNFSPIYGRNKRLWWCLGPPYLPYTAWPAASGYQLPAVYAALHWQLDRTGPMLDYACVCVCIGNNNVGNTLTLNITAHMLKMRATFPTLLKHCSVSRVPNDISKVNAGNSCSYVVRQLFTRTLAVACLP